MSRHALFAYFLLALAGTWIILVPVALAGGEYGLGVLPFSVPEGVDFLLVQLSAYTGPMLAAIVVTRTTEGRTGLRELRRRIVDWRIAPRWYLISLLAPLAIWVTVYSAALDGEPLQELARDWSLLLTTFLPFVAIGLLLPSLGEETGWRGFALPRLQQRYGPVVGTVILGAIHGVWHLPAFYTAALGPIGVTSVTTFMLTAVAGTFLYTWVFNGAKGSILIAILLHASSNAASGVLNKLVPEDQVHGGWTHILVDDGWITVLAFGGVALLLVAATRGRLGYQKTPL